MTSTPQPVWPSVESSATPSVSPAPVKTGRNASAATIAAVAIAGVVIGFAGATAINQAPSLAGLASLLNGGTPPTAAAPSTNAAPPVVSVNPNSQAGGTASRGGNGGQPAQSRSGNGGTGAQPAGN